jgi:hypothetical protein
VSHMTQPKFEPGQERLKELIDKIAGAINSVSAENGSNTPDFILAEFLVKCLRAFDSASWAREKWYGQHLTIGGQPSALPSSNQAGLTNEAAWLIDVFVVVTSNVWPTRELAEAFCHSNEAGQWKDKLRVAEEMQAAHPRAVADTDESLTSEQLAKRWPGPVVRRAVAGEAIPIIHGRAELEAHDAQVRAEALEAAAKLCLSAKVRPDGSCAGHTILDCHSSDAYWIRSTIAAPDSPAKPEIKK